MVGSPIGFPQPVAWTHLRKQGRCWTVPEFLFATSVNVTEFINVSVGGSRHVCGLSAVSWAAYGPLCTGPAMFGCRAAEAVNVFPVSRTPELAESDLAAAGRRPAETLKRYAANQHVRVDTSRA